MPGRSSRNTLSQQSLSSDDANIVAAVAQQMHTSWEKKKKEKENKFARDAKSSLDRCVSNRATEYAEAMAEFNEVYEKFIMDYAAVEDEIRNLWVHLLREQQKLLVLAEQKHKRVVESEKVRERGQVQGMAMAKKAMEDYIQLANSLRNVES
ncbi:uncharacterized protein LAESUDRAFT_233519 [Laetiporus sulphureus 93-53]|uniref:Uncharacterized protein n=1 Tax=Laetiporus sulphureus 93-53 TaxID=1314785 RepID=A0A165DML0_9APHY|nr:uncharacterized protein LAESUDRAFT_233519 [Laetiporus sulphureus 93-53]KZT05206.1 hypothetical protein LAESUDRAFT_233519 [Laetiporus sulphureus 93-53]